MSHDVPPLPKGHAPPEPSATPDQWAKAGRTGIIAAPAIGLAGLAYLVGTGMKFGDAVIAVIPLVVLIALISATIASFGDKSKLATAGALAVTLFVAFLLNQCVGSLP